LLSGIRPRSPDAIRVFCKSSQGIGTAQSGLLNGGKGDATDKCASEIMKKPDKKLTPERKDGVHAPARQIHDWAPIRGTQHKFRMPV
jgi:hypothetical protein